MKLKLSSTEKYLIRSYKESDEKDIPSINRIPEGLEKSVVAHTPQRLFRDRFEQYSDWMAIIGEEITTGKSVAAGGGVKKKVYIQGKEVTLLCMMDLIVHPNFRNQGIPKFYDSFRWFTDGRYVSGVNTNMVMTKFWKFNNYEPHGLFVVHVFKTHSKYDVMDSTTQSKDYELLHFEKNNVAEVIRYWNLFYRQSHDFFLVDPMEILGSQFYCGTTLMTNKDGSWAGVSHWDRQKIAPMVSCADNKPLNYEILCCYFYGGKNGKELFSQLISHLICKGKERSLDYLVLLVDANDSDCLKKLQEANPIPTLTYLRSLKLPDQKNNPLQPIFLDPRDHGVIVVPVTHQSKL